MKKSELKFRRNIKRQIDDLSKPNIPQSFWCNNPNPIYIPKRKYKN